MAEPTTKDITKLTLYIKTDGEVKTSEVKLQPFITGKLKLELLEVLKKLPKGKFDIFLDKHSKEANEVSKQIISEKPNITETELGVAIYGELMKNGFITIDESLALKEPEGIDFEKAYLEYVYGFIKLIIDYTKIDENLKQLIETDEFWEYQNLEELEKAIGFFRSKIGR